MEITIEPGEEKGPVTNPIPPMNLAEILREVADVLREVAERTVPTKVGPARDPRLVIVEQRAHLSFMGDCLRQIPEEVRQWPLMPEEVVRTRAAAIVSNVEAAASAQDRAIMRVRQETESQG